MLIKPSKKGVKAFLASIRETIKAHKGIATVDIISLLNPKIRGWANFYQHVISKHTFAYVDSYIFASIWQWCVRRHPNKNRHWVKAKYFHSMDNRHWVFAAKYKNAKGEWKTCSLIKAVHVPIRRHIKIRAKATPYDSEYKDYFEQRLKNRQKKSSKPSYSTGVI